MVQQPLLSILIPTVVGREESLDKFMAKHFGDNVSEFLYGDYVIKGKSIEVIISKDAKEITIGEKREHLYKKASGIFSWQIDDDDDIAPNAIQLILEAIKSNPEVDCITFEENCQMNGEYYKSNHSINYPDWYGQGSHLLHDGFHFHRTPFYKDVIKTSIAKSVPFKSVRYEEDHLWSIDLLPHLKTEIHIDSELYYYIYEPKDTPSERYGLNRD